jgi:hypothetical protein
MVEITAYQLIPILGWTNIIGFLLVLFSCRCLIGGRFSTRFYKYHCCYWWFFMGSVLIHTGLAFWFY